jgi:hypothetical protein
LAKRFTSGPTTVGIIPPDRSTIAEVYPSLWKLEFPRADRNDHQHDAFCVASWLSQADRDGSLSMFLNPDLSVEERAVGIYEGWILGVT